MLSVNDLDLTNIKDKPAVIVIGKSNLANILLEQFVFVTNNSDVKCNFILDNLDCYSKILSLTPSSEMLDAVSAFLLINGVEKVIILSRMFFLPFLKAFCAVFSGKYSPKSEKAIVLVSLSVFIDTTGVFEKRCFSLLSACWAVSPPRETPAAYTPLYIFE